MKKESIISTVFLLVVLAVAVIMGLTVISDAFEKMYESDMSPVLFTLIVLVLGFAFNVVWMEVAHVLGAKAGKCKVVAVTRKSPRCTRVHVGGGISKHLRYCAGSF